MLNALGKLFDRMAWIISLLCGASVLLIKLEPGSAVVSNALMTCFVLLFVQATFLRTVDRGNSAVLVAIALLITTFTGALVRLLVLDGEPGLQQLALTIPAQVFSWLAAYRWHTPAGKGSTLQADSSTRPDLDNVFGAPAE